MEVAEQPGLAEDDSCRFEVNLKHDVFPCAVCSACLSLGLVYTLFGFRCFRMVMFFSGFTFGSAAVLLLHHEEPLEAQLGSETWAGVGLGVGVLCGLVTMLVSGVGLLLSGLQLGGLLSLAVLVVAAHFHSLSPGWLPLGVVLTSGVVAAVATLQWQKLLTIVYTSVVGAAAVTLCLDFLLGTFALPGQVYDVFRQVAPRPLCWFHWALAGAWPVGAGTGVLVQWSLAARAAHKQTEHPKRLRASRRRPPPQRRRRPPLLKRYAGDVLAPSYLQRLQERHVGTGSSSSSAAHTLIDFDFETGSMVPLAASSPAFTV